MTDHHGDIDWAALGPALERGAEVQAPLFYEAIRWVQSKASRSDADGGDVRLVVDVGAGPGVITCMLADAFPSARVVAVDGTPGLIDRAVDRAERNGLQDRVEVRLADLPDGLDDLGRALGPAEVVWASHVVHHLGDQQQALRQMAGLLRPGGMLALAEGGLPSRTLPRDIGIGRAGLEARLDAANEAWFAEVRTALPGEVRVVEHWPSLLAGAGLVPAGSRTFLLQLPAPLEDDAREFVRRRLERCREGLVDWLEADDIAVLDQLLDQDGEHALERREDVFVLMAATVHLATAPPN
jgi:SAM-dependent methyltransferase